MTWRPDWFPSTMTWAGKPAMVQIAPGVRLLDENIPLLPNDPCGLILPWGARPAGSRRRQRERHRRQHDLDLQRQQYARDLERLIYRMRLAPYIHLYRRFL